MPNKAGMNFNPDDDLVAPLDYMLLGGLPEAGTLIAGAYPDGRTSKQLSNELFNGQVGAGKIGPRFNALIYHGLAVKVKGVGTLGALVYQRTPAGTKLHKEWLAAQPVPEKEGS